ncbi:MAG: right-handed parallel beta-helix repeat-containing protein [Bacteroidales bacterium]|jgi:hypothetical protein|nr:right-handed parallel beta-helix repeat-containing protein [Bacteroidales bacterium]
MRKIFIIVLGLYMSMQVIYSQRSQTWVEDFDSAVSFTAQPSNYWGINTIYFGSSSNSYRGRLPNSFGDSTILETPLYDLETLSYRYGQLRFRHICKIDSSDMVRIEYRIDELGPRGVWQPVPVDAYTGEALSYSYRGFNALSYPQWDADNLYTKPGMNCWKEEVFDLYFASSSKVQFRFIIKKGNTLGSQFAYGWLIDDFRVIASDSAIALPEITLINPVQDTVHVAGPFDITAEIQSKKPVVAYLEYIKILQDQTVTTHSLPMSNIGQNKWEASIPFSEVNTKIIYSVVAEDSLGNKNNAISSLYITRDKSKHYDSNAVSIVSLDSPAQNTVTGGVEIPVKISIRNEGDYVLTNATIHWSINGADSVPYQWSGNLPWSALDTLIEIGKYISSENKFDIIAIWITDINNLSGTYSDTLSRKFYGCTGTINGLITVEQGVNSISETIEILKTCGIGGDITLALENGKYFEDIDLSNFHSFLGNHRLTITSASGNRDSVILYPVNEASILLDNVNNITIDNITIDASGMQASAILFTGVCSNVVISNCVLLGDTTNTFSSTSLAPINKMYSTGIASNIRITNNKIKGGYYGIQFYGGTTGNYGKNIVIDSNELTMQHYYGLYIYDSELELLHNTIYYNKDMTTRPLNNNWRGIQVSGADGKIIGNRIYQLSGLTSSVGLFVVSLNQYQKEPGIISNNEIIINTGGSNSGVYLSTGTKAIFAHNSIYVSAVETSARVVYVTDNMNNQYTIKNNLLVLNDTTGYAIYLAGTNYALNYDIDYNNYYVYSPNGNIGYAGSSKKTLADWKATVKKDIHSTNKRPSFVDSLLHLALNPSSKFDVPYLPEVLTDINNNVRGGITSTGAYEYNYMANDAFLSGFIGWGNKTLKGNKDSLKVILVNGGTSPLTNVEIAWSFNGNSQTTKVWSGSLSRRETDTLLLDEIIYDLGKNTVKAWIKDFTNDEYHSNDTIYREGDFCDTMFHGTYVIGTSGVFATVNEAMDRMTTCGIDGAVILALEDGNYPSIDLSIYDNIQTTVTNSITIKSLSGNRDAVIIAPNDTTGILIGNIHHIIIDGITIDVSSQNHYGIQFTDACDSIVITHCNIKANRSSTSIFSSAIFKGGSTNLANNIIIKNNTLDGGYHSIFFYANNTEIKYGTGIVIDSNIMTNSYYYGIECHNADINSLSHNTIISRQSNATSLWYGVYLSNVNGKVNANKIHQLSETITSPTGIYLYSFNTVNTTQPGLISNNEIIISTNNNYEGIYLSSSVKAEIIHNSIYVGGTGTGRGITVSNNPPMDLVIKNNNLAVESNNGHPIYISSASLVSQCDIDYNNYYSPLNVGYVGLAIQGIPSWQAVVPTDLHSTNYYPRFINTSIDLRTQITRGFRCPSVANVLDDLDGVARPSFSYKGAYHFDAHALDIFPNVFVDLPNSSLTGTKIPIEVVFVNEGSDTVTSFNIGWTIKGITKNLLWSGSLANNEQVSVIIDTLAVLDGNNSIKVWTSDPNQGADADVSNDTLRGNILTCSAPLAAGVYTVGDDQDFPGIEAVQAALDLCGIGGDVTFSIYPEIYDIPLNIENIKGVNDTNSLSFVSHTGKAEDVVLQNVIIGDNMHKIMLKNLTIDGRYSNAGIRLDAPVRDITIDGCKIIANPYSTMSSTRGVYGIYLKGNSSDTSMNIRIVNNIIDGGYDGISIEGNISASYENIRDIWIDSNTLTNQGNYAICLKYASINSVSHNTILSGTGTSSYWKGIFLSNVNIYLVNANKIKQRSTTISYPNGIYMTTVNHFIPQPALITNNEIYIHAIDGSYYNGIYVLGKAHVKVLFNSIFANGKNSSAVMLANYPDTRLTLKYNNLFAADLCYPIYFASYVYQTATLDVGYNNYYSPSFIGYADGDHSTIAAWQTEVKYDTTSFSIKPVFIDSAISLELSNYTDMLCVAIQEVKKDIEGNNRVGVTTTGCYSQFVPEVNLALEEIMDFGKQDISGSKDTVRVILRNGGSTPVTSAVISYQFNATTIHLPVWTGLLETGEADTITLGELQYIPGWNNLTTWIDSLPGLTDPYQIDDTISVVKFFCDTSLSGTYVVGTTSSNSDFSTIAEAVTLMYRCGINAPVTFELEDRLYLEHVRLEKPIPGSSAVNTVTFTSASGKASDVTIQRPDDTEKDLAPFMLKNVSNIIISNLTLSALSPLTSSYYYAKGFILEDNCSNIEINACRIELPKFGDPTTGSSDYSGIYAEGMANNIRMLDNTIDGGVHGIYFRGTTASTINNIYIADNIIPATDKGGIYIEYADSITLINNVLRQRNETEITYLQTFHAIYLSTTNKITVLQNSIKASKGLYGIYLSKVNENLSVLDGLIANNEIMMYVSEATLTTARQGIYVDAGVKTQIYHNSILIEGISSGNGLHVVSSTTTALDIQNNILGVATPMPSYPVYFATATDAMQCNFAYNNYYSATNTTVGFLGVPKETLIDWVDNISADIYSVSTTPLFVKTETDLSLQSNYGIECPILQAVSVDINNNPRTNITTMGAYHYTSLQNDVLLYEILSPLKAVFDTTDVIISMYNLGTDTLKNITVYWEVNGVPQTPFVWNGELAPNKISAPVTIGRMLPDKRTNEFVIWTADPNGVADNNISNDTIRILVHACSSALSGTYTIGATSPDFKTINEAIEQLYTCGINAPVIFKLDTGEFMENITLKGLVAGSSAVNTITFTSVGEHYDSTTIRHIDDPNKVEPTITLENVANIKFTNLKISGWDLSAEYYLYAVAIVLKDGCENIEFSNCYLEIPYFTETVNSMNYSVIIRMTQTGIPVSDIRILNNIISGGAYGIYHSGSSMGVKKDNNILIQDNQIINTDKYGIRFGTAENISVLNNTITQRPFTGLKQAFNGIYFYSITGDNIVCANRIKADLLEAGIDLTQSPGLIANNEIIGFEASVSYSSYGIYASAISGKAVRIIHNSVLMASNKKPASVYSVKGVYLGTSYNYELKNNHIVTMDSMSVPVYISSTYDSERYDINYNNYYNPYHIGYVSDLKTTLADWKKTVTNDIHSLSTLPKYDTAQLKLRPVDTVGFTCPMINGVNTDIDGMARYKNTLRGAYTASVLDMDVAIADIRNIPEISVTGEKYAPSIRIKNYGTTLISEVIIEYTVNGILPAYTKTWMGTLNKLEEVVVTLDTLSSLLGKNDIVVWIASVNTLSGDDYLQNDTVRMSFNACDSLYSGDYIVGAVNGDFTSVMEGITKFKSCGVKGDIVLRLERGTYEETWNLVDLDFMENYTLTITSLDNHKDSVILQPKGTVNKIIGIVLANANNITIKHLTIDAATKAQKGIQFAGACDNIIIDSCNIFVHPTATANSYIGIDKESSTGLINNLTITHNVIDGGCYGLSLYGGSGSSYRGNNIRIDSNLFSNAYFYGIYLNYVGVTLSNNIVLSRKNATNSWYGMSLNNSAVNANANKIHFHGATSSIYGIYGYSINNTSTDIHSKITNNEIIVSVSGNGTTGYGICFSSSKALILNNSVLVKGTTAKSKGITINSSSSSYNYVVKNNNIVMQSPDAYPIHLENATYLSQLDINYNNYFAPKYVGSITSTNYATLASWQAVVLSDRQSVREEPLFVDTAQSLELIESDALRCLSHREAASDITGTPREKYTTMGAYSYSIVEQDLALTEILSPSNRTDLCSPSYLPVRYVVKNNGSKSCNFSNDSLMLYFSMTGPITFDTVVVINTASLNAFAADTFELKTMLDVSYAGDYDIEAWIATSSFDTVRSNDTLRMTYYNTKIALPFDNDFSMFNLTSFTVKSFLKDSVWKVVDTNHHATIKPYYGTGMLVFEGEYGTISQISTGQLELNRTQQPVLEFWYLHDNDSHEQEDQLDVRLTCDGGATYTTLFNIMRYDSNATVWKKYLIDLSQYQDSSCVIISFNGYSHGKTQYIDRIAISSIYDLAVSGAIISPYSVCDLEEKEVKVILTNQTGQNIDFDAAENNTEIVIEVAHNGTVVSKNTYPLTGLLKGLASDTITDISKVNLSPGTYIVTSYLTKAIDNTPENDIHIDTFIINPSISVKVHPVSTSVSCLAAETKIRQVVTLINSGNMDLYDIKLTLQIDTGEINNMLYTTFSEIKTDTITAGDTVSYTFTNAYIVPWNITAYVQVIAYLDCDTVLVNSKDAISECVNMKDLYIVSIDNPTAEKDNIDDNIYVTTTLSNRSDYETFTDANITVLVTNSQGIETERFTETKTINILTTTSHTFTQHYKVPNDTVYYLTVYTDHYDDYIRNDTFTIKRGTIIVGVYPITAFEGFTLSQNIPNPVSNATRIDYSVPETGQVVFCIQSIGGQILYSKTIETTSGKHSLKLNTDNLSAGVYFYSLEYKGQRLVKRMCIKK